MKNVIRRIFCVLCVILLVSFSTISYAHSGRTDASGGHHDYKNKSGLGSYHYHHGLSAHLHPNGVCPYSSSGSTSSSQSSGSSQSTEAYPSISIKDYPSTINIGESASFEFSVSNATNDERSVTSSDSNIVNVNADGSLTAINVGVAEITISASGVTETFRVEVKPILVEDIKIFNIPAKIQIGEKYQLEALVFPADATDKSVLWSSDNTSILEISETGELVANAPGIVTITGTTTNNVEDSITVEIIGVCPDTIECEKSINLIVGDIHNLNINIMPQDAVLKDFTVNCENSEIVEYSEGSIQALNEGETILHIETWNGIKQDVQIKVDIIPVENIKIRDSEKPIEYKIVDKSDDLFLLSEIKPNNATHQNIMWDSSDNGIISIENDNFVIHDTGKVTITCNTEEGVSDSIEVYVVNKNLIFVVIPITAVVIIIVVICFKKKSRK